MRHTILDTNIRGDLNIETRDGNDMVKVATSESLLGSNQTRATRIRGDMWIRAGDDSDDVSLRAVEILGKADVNLGDGDNRAQVDLSDFKGTFFVRGGVNTDTVSFGKLEPGGTFEVNNVFRGEWVSINLGRNEQTLTPPELRSLRCGYFREHSINGKNCVCAVPARLCDLVPRYATMQQTKCLGTVAWNLVMAIGGNGQNNQVVDPTGTVA